nr:hypothetical protein [Fodinicola feengrottensis]
MNSGSGSQSTTSAFAVSGPGIGKPSSAPVRSRSSGVPAGGVRARAVARPMVAAKTTTSTAASRTNAPRAPAARAGSVRRRCHQPKPPNTTRAANLSSTIRP